MRRERVQVRTTSRRPRSDDPQLDPFSEATAALRRARDLTKRLRRAVRDVEDALADGELR